MVKKVRKQVRDQRSGAQVLLENPKAFAIPILTVTTSAK